MDKFWDKFRVWFTISFVVLLCLIIFSITSQNVTSVTSKMKEDQQWTEFRHQNYLACVERQVPKDECYVRIYK